VVVVGAVNGMGASVFWRLLAGSGVFAMGVYVFVVDWAARDACFGPVHSGLL
jgi:hypothetical protein